MMKLSKQAIGALAGLGLLFGNVAMVMADTTVDINTTGADSWNKAYVSTNCTNVVSQSNKSSIKNSIFVKSNTGQNQANKNTGDGTVVTGNIATGIGVLNGGNSNTANGENPCCECAGGDVDVTVEKTGADSYNKAKVSQSTTHVTTQKNWSWTSNWLTALSETGKNKANKNTGNGSVDTTGTVETGVEVVNEGSTNNL